MITALSFAAAVLLSLSLFLSPIGLVAWAAAICWALFLYGLHRSLTESEGFMEATVTAGCIGALTASFLGYAMHSSLIGLTAAAATAGALLMRGLYPLLAARFLSIE